MKLNECCFFRVKKPQLHETHSTVCLYFDENSTFDCLMLEIGTNS